MSTRTTSQGVTVVTGGDPATALALGLATGDSVDAAIARYAQAVDDAEAAKVAAEAVQAVYGSAAAIVAAKDQAVAAAQQAAVNVASQASDAGIAAGVASVVANLGRAQKDIGLSVLAYGYVGDGVADDTAALNSAMAAAETYGVPVTIPPGTVAKVKGAYHANILTARAVALRSSGGTRILVAADQPAYNAVFGSSADVSGFTLEGLVIDQNSANVIPSTVAAFEYQFAVQVTTGKNIAIRGCTFQNCDGLNTITLNGSGAFPLRVQNITVTGNRFLNIGTDQVRDHSTIYTNAEVATIEGNIFIGRATAAKSALCAVETHGSAHRIIGNHIEGYREAINATGVTYRADGIVVADNTIRRVLRGIRVYPQGLYGGVSPSLRAMVITGNSIILDPDFWASTWDLEPQGVIFTSTADFAVHGLKIRNNTIICLPYSGTSTNMVKLLAGGIVYSRTGGTTNPDRALDIGGNTIIGTLSAGIILIGLKAQVVSVCDNQVIDCASPLLVTSNDYRAGIALLTGEAIGATVSRNRVYDFRTGSAAGTSVGVGWFRGGASATSTEGEISDNQVKLVQAGHYEVRVGATSGAPYVRHTFQGGTVTNPTADCAVGSALTVKATGVTTVQAKAPSGQVWVGRTTTTAARPAAVDVGAGFGPLFDTTLGKPIWSTGAVWKDAAGATV